MGKKKNAKDKGKTPDEHKADGNEAFQNGDFDAAIACYTKAITKDDTNPSYFTNRAMTYINMSQFQKAVEDTERAIKLNPQFLRAY